MSNTVNMNYELDDLRNALRESAERERVLRLERAVMLEGLRPIGIIARGMRRESEGRNPLSDCRTLNEQYATIRWPQVEAAERALALTEGKSE